MTLFGALLLAAAAAYAVPRAVEEVSSLGDPSYAAGRALDGTFDAALARGEIETALSAQDAELAQSFVELAGARHVSIDPALAERAAAAAAEAAGIRHRAKSFARGFVTGEPQDMASFAGTTLGDLFIFGDIRDALREGARYVQGENVDELMLGLAAAGLAVTAGTYATAGAGIPARAGLSLVKVARKSGRLGVEFTESIGRLVRQASLPALSRGMREGTKVERAGGLLHLVRDVGRLEKAAGGRAALDALKLARNPRDVARIAKLAEKEGSRTRAILKVAGRSAIALAVLTFDAAGWLLGAILAAFGFVTALKSAVERTTLRILRRRRERRAARQAIAAGPARS
ncbi:MAG TPA: hypothetical protein VFB29_13565 [Pseudolabrys sp.]|nr:hypothetical protein [Pseudolabrys sp.]